MSITYAALKQKADQRQKRMEECEANGGHAYHVDGFSQIVHPETRYSAAPQTVFFGTLWLSEGVTFRAYICAKCETRVSVDEGRRYNGYYELHTTNVG